MRSVWRWILTASVVLLLAPSLRAQDRVPIFVSIVPQQYFVQRIGQDLVNVRVMVRPGDSPATYEPKPRQMAAISGTRIYFAIGVPFERVWLKKIASSNPDMKVIHTDAGISKLGMESDHHHHPAAEQRRGSRPHDPRRGSEAIADPHIWLSPPLVMQQAHAILSALQQVDPDHRSDYASNYAAFRQDLLQLDGELQTIFSGKQGSRFMVFHPSWGYFAHTYGLEQVPIEIEGKDPKPAQLRALIAYARTHQIKVVFAQPQFSAKNARQIAREIGGRVAFVDPLALNWPENLRRAAEQFNAALR